MLSRLAGVATTAVRAVRRLLFRKQNGPVPTLGPDVIRTTSRVDPPRHARLFRQPDGTSCGAASLVFSRMVHEPSYAERLLAEPTTWSDEVKAVHRRVGGVHDHDGRVQWPWPRFLGTSPWGAARQMGGGHGRCGAGTVYRAHILDPDDLRAGFDMIAAAVHAGHTVPLYVGTELRPAHVVLIVAVDGDRLGAYEPSAGRFVRVRREAFTAGRFSLGGWSVPWFAVLPR